MKKYYLYHFTTFLPITFLYTVSGKELFTLIVCAI